MVDRTMVFAGAIPLDSDILKPQQNTMIALGYLMQALAGTGTVFAGLACNPTTPASMAVQVGSGAIMSMQPLESSDYGSLPKDTTDQLMKMGINASAQQFNFTAPASAGQSQCYVIQASFSEADGTPNVLSYYNSSNPAQPYSGPGNSGNPQNTQRNQRVNLGIKVGAAATTGSQTIPSVDPGYYGLWVITLATGQTAITSTSIAMYNGAPFLTSLTSSHHYGNAGNAPKIHLETEVQGIIQQANLPPNLSGVLVYAGNPNGHMPGTAGSVLSGGSTPPSRCYDIAFNRWWTCVTSGTATTAVWSCSANSLNLVSFTSTGNWTVPAGVTQVKVIVTGGGGGGSSSAASLPASTTNSACGGGGGAGGTAIGVVNVTPGQVITCTVGQGGTQQANGGTSSFGSSLSATGGLGASFTTASTSPGGGGGQGTGGTININGGFGGDGQSSAYTFSGYGGGSYWGGGVRGATVAGQVSGAAWGGGGGGAYNGNGAGSPGTQGIVVLEYI